MRIGPGNRAARAPTLPLYFRIARLIQNRIYHDVYRPGEAIPSEAELSREFGVTRLTVRQATGELRAEGILYARMGAGTYVAEDIHVLRPVNFIGYLDDVVLQSQRMHTHLCRAEATEVPNAVRARLALARSVTAFVFERTRSLEGQPVSHAINYTQARYLRRAPRGELERMSLPELLAQHGRVVITAAEQSLTAAAAPSDVAERLALRPGAPVLFSELLAFAGSNPVSLSCIYYRPDQTLFTASLTSIAVDERSGKERRRVPVGTSGQLRATRSGLRAAATAGP